MTLGIGLILAATPLPVHAQPPDVPIVIDGLFDDWTGRLPLHRDAARDGAGQTDGVDFGDLWIANDARYLFVRLEVGTELLLQDRNELILIVDADDDVTTGRSMAGLGAELQFHLGQRRGTWWNGSDSVPVEYNDIGLMAAPTVSSHEFELAFDRRARPDGTAPLFGGPRLRLAFTDGRTGDRLPDGPRGVEYVFAAGPFPSVTPTALEKHDPGHLRFLSHNGNNRLFDDDRRAAYRRVFRALQPDVVALQEIRHRSSAATAAYVAPMLSPTRSGEWYHARAGREGNVVLSVFPIRRTDRLGNSGAFLLDLGRKGAQPDVFLVIVLSLPCCDRGSARQHELNTIMEFVRDARTPGGVLDLPPRTPIVLIGDANLVGHAHERTFLLTGGGAGPGPDWNGRPFTDLRPRHTHGPLTFTWRGPLFPAGRLDYVVYSDAVLDVGNHFVLYTPDLPTDALARYGLRADDVVRLSDHLPIVVDFVLEPRGAGSAESGRR